MRVAYIKKFATEKYYIYKLSSYVLLMEVKIKEESINVSCYYWCNIISCYKVHNSFFLLLTHGQNELYVCVSIKHVFDFFACLLSCVPSYLINHSRLYSRRNSRHVHMYNNSVINRQDNLLSLKDSGIILISFNVSSCFNCLKYLIINVIFNGAQNLSFFRSANILITLCLVT